MGMEYKGLDANTELSLLVVTPKGKDTIYTLTINDKADYYGEVFIDMSTEEVTRLRDELSFILEHERQHAEAAEHRAFAAEAMKEVLKQGPLLAQSFGHGEEAGLSVDDPAKLAALTEAAQARHFNEVCEQSDMDQLNGPLGE